MKWYRQFQNSKMGAFGSRIFIRNDDIDGQGKIVLITAKRLNLQNYDIDKLFHEFAKYSNPLTHRIELNVLFKNIKLQQTIFSDILFQLFIKTKIGSLSFVEYLVACWTIMTSNDDMIAELCFQIFDTER